MSFAISQCHSPSYQLSSKSWTLFFFHCPSSLHTALLLRDDSRIISFAKHDKNCSPELSLAPTSIADLVHNWRSAFDHVRDCLRKGCVSIKISGIPWGLQCSNHLWLDNCNNFCLLTAFQCAVEIPVFFSQKSLYFFLYMKLPNYIKPN